MQSTRTETTAVAAAAESAAATRQYLTFALGAESYAAPIDAIREILEVPALTAVPLMPPFVRGVMNLRGAVVPVIDLTTRFELGETRIARRSCVVVVEVGGDDGATQVLGVLVDAVHEVLDIAATDIAPAPTLGTRIDPRFICGMARVAQRLLVVLDLRRVLAGGELAQLVAAHVGA